MGAFLLPGCNCSRVFLFSSYSDLHRIRLYNRLIRCAYSYTRLHRARLQTYLCPFYGMLRFAF
nr:MAG TPA: hypothetical protein [Bacteriophage sp.]